MGRRVRAVDRPFGLRRALAGGIVLVREAIHKPAASVPVKRHMAIIAPPMETMPA
jgi:hypothetical protein